VEHGALYPALQRLEERKWIAAEWGVSTGAAHFYKLTKTGRHHLAEETSRWRRLSLAIGRILGPEKA
jgi:DNA-binding PadR family transcriptional regulator